MRRRLMPNEARTSVASSWEAMAVGSDSMSKGVETGGAVTGAGMPSSGASARPTAVAELLEALGTPGVVS
eukprot:8905504-Heterocapsa_arctica.AAC.1